MNYDNNFPEWKNEGVEPSDRLKETGFAGGYKPAASIFNWFWSKVMKAISELQTKLSEVTDNFSDTIAEVETSISQQEVEDFQGYKAVECSYNATIIGGNFYSGIASESGIDVGYIKGRSVQEGTPTPSEPIDIESFGDSEVNFYTHGLNLFDASKLPTKTQGGATVTNNGDGSFTISGSGTLTETFGNYYYFNYSSEYVKSLLKVGSIKFNINDVYPRPFVQIKGTNGTLLELNRTVTSGTITQKMLDDEGLHISIGFYGTTENTIVTGTVTPVLYQDGDGTFEEYKEPQTATVIFTNPLRSLPNGVCDTYENGVITRKVGKVVIDGTSTTVSNTNTHDGSFVTANYTLSDAKQQSSNNIISTISDKLVGANITTTWNGTTLYTVSQSANGNYLQIALPNECGTTNDTVNAWLAANPITVLYELDAPVQETFEIPTIASYNPNTSVHHNSETEANLIIWHLLKGGGSCTVTSDIPLHLSVTEDGILEVTY